MTGTDKYDLFLSYSTVPDRVLARKIESFLESFHRLKLPGGQALRPLQVCRDQSDFTLPSGSRRDESGNPSDSVRAIIQDQLAKSGRLLVLCSANSRSSTWVGLELEPFLRERPQMVLLAATEGSDPAARPEDLFRKEILGAGIHERPWYDFRGFRKSESRNWNKVKELDEELVRLAAHLHGTTLGQLLPVYVQEEERRKSRQNTVRAVAGTVFLALLLIISFIGISRERLDVLAEARRLASAAETIREQQPGAVVPSALLAAESLLLEPTLEGDTALRRGIQRLPVPIARIPTTGEVSAVAASADGKSFAFAVEGNGIHLWRAHPFRESGRASIPGRVRRMIFGTGDAHLIALTESGVIFIINTATGAVRERISSFRETLALSVSDTSILALGEKGSFAGTVEDTRSHRSLVKLEHDNRLIDACFSGDGRFAMTGGYDFKAVIQDVAKGKPPVLLQSDRPVTAVALDQDGTFAATGENSGPVRVWSLVNGRSVLSRSHDDWISHLAFSQGSNFLGSASRDGTGRVWCVESGLEVARMVHEGPVFAIAFFTDNRQVITGSTQEAVVWSLDWKRHDGKATAVAFAGKEGPLITADSFGAIAVWPDSPAEKPTWFKDGEGQQDAVLAVGTSVTGMEVTAIHDSGVIRRWDGRTGKLLHKSEPKLAGAAAAMDRNGRKAVVGNWNGAVSLIEPATGSTLKSLNLPEGKGAYAVALSRDGRMLGAGGEDGVVLLWDSQRQHQSSLQVLGTVYALAWDPEGLLLAIGGEAPTVMIWDTTTGRSFREISVLSTVKALRFSPCGRNLAIAAGEQVQLWDIGKRSELCRIDHKGVTAITFSDDGHRLATAGDDQMVRVSSVTREEILKEAKRRLSRPLTPAEWTRYVGNQQVYRPAFLPDSSTSK
jgi:WD40 repeat protein